MQQQQALQLKLAITPSLRQALDILSYPMTDLLTYIQEQADSNPLMEVSYNRLEKHSIDMAKMQNSPTSQSVELYEQASTSVQTMEQFLLEQVAAEKTCNAIQRKLLVYLIHHLNDAGYLECDLEEAAEQFTLSVDEGLEVLKVLQSFEPTGIGARSLAECLVLQLREAKQIPSYTEDILLYHLEMLASRNFKEIAAIYRCDEVHIERVLDFIQTLNPRPVFDVYTEQPQYILPDLLLENLAGETILQVNDQYLPDISISTVYDELLKDNEEVVEFMKGKIGEIMLLKKGIEQRHLTLYKVAQAILEAQPRFISEGVKGLQPLRLREIAEKTGFHESTISRTINKKYIQTPQGTFLLKQFFKRGLLNKQGTNQDIALIQQQLQTLIEYENREKPYSDQQLVRMLAEKGSVIARRTVAKYREQLAIPPSSKRRRQ